MQVCPRIQVIDGEGQFLEDQVQAFADDTRLAECNTDYQVVAIMGPQSSGKSTLLNNVFGTSFVMMDAMSGRSQTTKGIWLSKSPKLADSLTTLVMDLEGNDGRERGEDDTNFERQSALFALAVADVLLVNIWCHDIGREQGAGKPLLKTIFQVNLKLFAPDPSRKRVVLLFVIRDKTKTPLNKLVEVMEADLRKMWDSITKPVQYEHSALTDFFEVQYAGMSHYEEKHEDFLADTVMLRRRFTPDCDDSLVRPHDNLPGAAFVLSTKSLWDLIRSQKDLNLPAHKVMVANIRCAEIAAQQLQAFTGDQAWQTLQAEAVGTDLVGGAASPGLPAGAAQGGPGPAGDLPAVVRSFNSRLSGLLESCIAGYEADAMYFDAAVRADKLAELRTSLAAAVSAALQAQLRALHATQLAAATRDLTLALLSSSTDAAAASKPAPGAAAASVGDSGRADSAASHSAQAGAAPGSQGVQFGSAAQTVRAAAASAFRKAYVQDLQLDPSTRWASQSDVMQEVASFEAALDALIASERASRITAATSSTLKALKQSLGGPLTSLLEACPPGVWSKMHAVTQDAAARAQDGLAQALAGFSLTAEERHGLAQQLQAAAQARLAAHMREAALTRLSRMRDRFTESFSLDANKTPRMWTARDHIPSIARDARLAAARLLAQLAVIRPAPAAGGAPGPAAPSTAGGEADAADAVEAAVMRMAAQDLEQPVAADSSGGAESLNRSASSRPDGVVALDLLSASCWPGVAADAVLLEPHEVRATWREFMASSNIQLQQALSTQQANKLAGNKGLPIWAVFALLFLGWNEFMAVLWNPVYLVLGIVLLLFGRTMYTELDIDTEMSRGTLPGLVSIGAKLLPAAQRVWSRTLESLQSLQVTVPEELKQVRQFIREAELTQLLRTPEPAGRATQPDESRHAAQATQSQQAYPGHNGTGAASGSSGWNSMPSRADAYRVDANDAASSRAGGQEAGSAGEASGLTRRRVPAEDGRHGASQAATCLGCIDTS